MIVSFGDRLSEVLFDDKKTRETRHFPPGVRNSARRKLLYLHEAAELSDLASLPGNCLEALKGGLKGFYSVRINDQWRIIFRWEKGQASDVRILDYHS